MTTPSTLPAPGSPCTLCIQGLRVPVTLMAVKRAYGHLRVQVQAPGGSAVWVNADKIDFDHPTKEPS